jgi:competence protein ComGC
MKCMKKDEAGFTLIEMMIVIIIISTLLLIAVPNVCEKNKCILTNKYVY